MKIALISTDIYIYSHGIRAISAYLKLHGHETILLSMPIPFPINDDTIKKLNFTEKYSEETLRSVKKLIKDCDIIGINSLAATSGRTIQIIESLKELKKPIVWGGIFPTTFPDYCIKYCDIICIGEGEEALLELANKLEEKKQYIKTKNFWFKVKKGQKEKIIKNPLRPLIDINSMPNYDYDRKTNFVLKKNKFSRLNDFHIGNWIYYHGIRGCAFSCKYCCNYHLQKIYEGRGERIRKRDIKLVIKDLIELKNNFPKINWIWITDDDINMRSIEELKEFSRLYKKFIGLPFRAYMNPLTINEEKLKLLIAAGLGHIEVGVQSGSNYINNIIYGRPIKRESIIKSAEILNKYKKKLKLLTYQIMTNNPYESEEDALDTINLLFSLPSPFWIQTFGIVFFPGTILYQKAIKDNLIKSLDESAFNIDYLNMYEHTKIRNKNLYFNTIINLMYGKATKYRIGVIPRFLLKFILKENVKNYFEKHNKMLIVLNKIQYTFIYIPNKLRKIRAKYHLIKGFFYFFIPTPIKKPIKKFMGLR